MNEAVEEFYRAEEKLAGTGKLSESFVLWVKKMGQSTRFIALLQRIQRKILSIRGKGTKYEA